MLEWFWIGVSVTLALLLVYTWTRKAPTDEPAVAKSAPPPPSSSTSRTAVAGEATAEAKKAGTTSAALPKLDYEEDEDVDPTKIGKAAAEKRAPLQAPTKRIVYDEDAAQDEPTHSGALILVTATAQTDTGLHRKRNEDSVLALAEHSVYVVADGMGGYRGGEIASAIAVSTIEKAFREGDFEGEPHDSIPPRASELARAIQMANAAILTHAEGDTNLAGMGTTICAVRFSPNKQRLYVGHVGDSRIYRVRAGTLKQMTADHTMKDLGVTGAAAAHLSRAVGVWPTVPIDILLGKPKPQDLYILCSDGLTKMVSDAKIADIATSRPDPENIVRDLIEAANKSGGKDNISVIVIRVVDPAKDSAAPSPR